MRDRDDDRDEVLEDGDQPVSRRELRLELRALQAILERRFMWVVLGAVGLNSALGALGDFESHAAGGLLVAASVGRFVLAHLSR
jgi:hypothetical protein